MYYVLRIAGVAEIILAVFNLAVSTPTAKLPNLNPHQIYIPAKFSGYAVSVVTTSFSDLLHRA